MFWADFFDFPLWWIFTVLMMVFCLFMMRGRRGSMMCGFGPRRGDDRPFRRADSAMDILDKRYAEGVIDRNEYEEKKETLMQTQRHD